MCREVVIGDESFATIGDLRAKLGELAFMDPNRLCADFHCLCPVDMQATAAKHGYTMEVGAFDFVLTKTKGERL
jgi:hypothetical protein